MNEQLAYVQVTGELLYFKQKLNIISVSRSSKSAKISWHSINNTAMYVILRHNITYVTHNFQNTGEISKSMLLWSPWQARTKPMTIKNSTPM